MYESTNHRLQEYQFGVSVIFLNVLRSDFRVAAIDSVLITMRAQPQQSAISFFLCTGAFLYAPYSFLKISNKFWMWGSNAVMLLNRGNVT
jgi:hypothetical protein